MISRWIKIQQPGRYFSQLAEYVNHITAAATELFSLMSLMIQGKKFTFPPSSENEWQTRETVSFSLFLKKLDP